MQVSDFTPAQADALLPARAPETSKNDYGRVWAFCGSRGYTGAAYFAAQAAVRMGSGIVTLAVPDCIYPILAVKLNEPVIRPYTRADWREALAGASRAAACLIGPGLGHFEDFVALTLTAVRELPCPLVLDADGINALAGHIDVLCSAAYPVVLTPHAGEFARLTGIAHPTAQDAADFAARYRCVLLLKSHRTLIAAPDGTVTRNVTGNPGMAKGGSGDVLAGMLLSLLGQGLPPAGAARAAASLHGQAGDRCANALSEYGMTPTDLLDELPRLLHKFNSREW